MKAMLLSAGLGTRLKPFTLEHPKALFPVNGIPLLQRNIEYLAGYGITEIVVNVHHFAEQIIDFVNKRNFGVKITISDERDAILETGGGLLKAREYLEDAGLFVLMNVDILTDLELDRVIDFHQAKENLVSLAVSRRKSSRMFLLDEAMRLCGWRNKQNGEEKIMLQKEPLQEFAFSGIHILNSDIFKSIRQQGKFSIIDTYLDLAGDFFIEGYDHTGISVLDVGKPEAKEIAEKMFR